MAKKETEKKEKQVEVKAPITLKDQSSEELGLILSELWQQFMQAQTNINNINAELRRRQSKTKE